MNCQIESGWSHIGASGRVISIAKRVVSGAGGQWPVRGTWAKIKAERLRIFPGVTRPSKCHGQPALPLRAQKRSPSTEGLPKSLILNLARYLHCVGAYLAGRVPSVMPVNRLADAVALVVVAHAQSMLPVTPVASAFLLMFGCK